MTAARLVLDPTAEVRSMAQRAGADVAELEGSHVIMASRPQAVVDVIVTAARTAGRARR